MPLFDHVPEASRTRLDALAERVLVKGGERFIRAGETDGDLYRVERGTVEVVDAQGQPEVVLDVLGPGAVVGEMAFLAQEPRSADVRAFEDSELLRWRALRLRQALGQDAVLARDFYQAVSVAMVDRVRSAASLRRAPPPRVVPAGAAALEWARDLAERVKTGLLALENPIRLRDREPARRALAALWESLLEEGGRGFQALSPAEGEAAGQLLSRELHPYLLRARTGDLALARPEGRAGGAAVLLHLEGQRPQGVDPLGVALDELLLGAPTVQAHLERLRVAQVALGELVATERPRRVTVLGCGSGALVGALAAMLREGGELTCVDGDRELLNRLDGATISRAPRLSLRLLHEDLGLLVLGEAALHLPPQDLILVSGLVEYLPDPAVFSLGRMLRESLARAGVVVLDHIRNSPDRFVFDHLLAWPLLRRSREPFAALLGAVGLGDARSVACRGAVMVFLARAQR